MNFFVRQIRQTRQIRQIQRYGNQALALHQSDSWIRSNEGLTTETSAFQSLYGGQFTLSTPLINQIFLNLK